MITIRRSAIYTQKTSYSSSRFSSRAAPSHSSSSIQSALSRNYSRKKNIARNDTTTTIKEKMASKMTQETNQKTNKLREENLVSAEWLKENLAKVRVLDASWYMPADKRDTKKEFIEKRIPGSVFFDIDEISDKETDLPHMLPRKEIFEQVVGEMGIDNSDHVVVYDTKNLFSAPRVWWMFKVFGHDKVSVLDGGFPQWISRGYPVESGQPVPPQTKVFKAQFRKELVRSMSEMKENIEKQNEQVIDARSAERFLGKVDEPRPGLKRGNIPGSINIPFASLLGNDGKMKSDEELRNIFESAKVSTDLNKTLVTSCGSGVSACVVFLGLHILGRKVAVYDGSWAEWGRQ